MKTTIKTCILMVVCSATQAIAQQTAPANGRIVGRVVDAQTGAGLSAVTVQVVGTRLGVMTGVDGRFVLSNVPEGTIALRVLSLGYAPKTVTGLAVDGGAALEQNISLETEAVAIEGIEVTAAAERGSVNRALDQQRTAANIVSAVTSEQITKSPDSDAAQAVQRISGVTVQDNKFVIVRGLGERYTTASLNGARIPSPEPERKLVPLDLFPSSLLETITTSKTFTPDQPGDFSGAQVDLKLREFPASSMRAITSSFGWNGEATGRSVLTAPAAGGEWIGFASGPRAVPAGLRDAGRFTGEVTQDQMNMFVNSMRNVWNVRGGTGRPTGSFGLALGGGRDLFGQRIGYALSGTYSYGHEVRTNEIRAAAQPDETGATKEIDRYAGSTGRTSALWGTVLNASTLLGSSTRLALNATYNRSADNEARQDFGTSEQFNVPLEVTRLRYVERGVGSVQLLGEHEFGDRHRMNWAATASQVRRSEPDRSEFVYVIQSDPVTGEPLPREWFASAAEGAVRTYADLTESALEAKADYRIGLGAARSSSVKIGALARSTERAVENFAYSITAPTLPVSDRRLSPEEIFDGRFSQAGQSYFQLKPLSQGGSYSAADRLYAAYGMLDLGFTHGIRMIAGARVERWQLDIIATPTLGETEHATPAFTDVLPSLSLNIALTNNQNLRLSASQTLSRPEYREVASVCYRDVIGAENVCGNSNLVRTQIRNFDARWELYPANGEVLSLAAFGKQFKDPVERVFRATSGTRVVTFLNAEAATNYGIELEARKRLGFVAASLENLTGFVNATFMKSRIDLGQGQFSNQSVERPMVGQSPYVVNAGLTYSNDSGSMSVTTLYNIYGKRIVSAGERPLPDAYEQPRAQFDVALRFPLVRSVSAKLDFKNLLDAPYEVTQGVAVREYYRSGRVFSAGISWRP